jgi:hypothetical protein
MRRAIGLLALAALAAGTLVISGTPAGAQATTQVWVVHGLNWDGQSAPGGTAVTVCVDGSLVDGDLQFGDIIGPLPLTSGETVNVEVFDGAGVDCANPGNAFAQIDEDVTPTGAAVALVATFEVIGPPPAGSQLATIPLDVDCTEAGQGRVTAAHTANAGEVDVVATIAGNEVVVDTLAFGEEFTAELPVGTYPVTVKLAGTDTVIAGPLDVPVEEGTYLAAFVVGRLPAERVTPVVVLTEVNEVGVCEEPTTTTTTTAAPTTTVKPTTTTAKAAAATATPRYTG